MRTGGDGFTLNVLTTIWVTFDPVSSALTVIVEPGASVISGSGADTASEATRASLPSRSAAHAVVIL